ncbi:hypothetical protein CW731_08205 [Polaribacter sp. ALD11]|uniref:carboxypeptidase-like regulatory domain-containing protein n=1 Tax=Polaribacter sp. ALD11 TaxID=2058137 RepID=UPI000C308FD3|nr:carboxypeptidase-like regulatory domain-containing protein [Polaribacter sp. ALD11]AUC85272.1 hypothetical protein CW731_08205 [Polaribacter sp. ALD11]
MILSSLFLFYTLNNKIKSEPNFVDLKQKKDSLIIYGKIKDNVSDSFKYAKVEIQSSKQKIKVSKKGSYEINVTELFNKKNELILKFSFLGYKTEKRKVNKELFKMNNMLEINIRLKENNIVIECPTGK